MLPHGGNAFNLFHYHGGEYELVFEGWVGGLGSQSYLFPTPLVIEAPTDWCLDGLRWDWNWPGEGGISFPQLITL